MNADTTARGRITPLVHRRRSMRPEMDILYAAYHGYDNGPFLGCFREVEQAIRARRKRIPKEPPVFPRATIRRLGSAGPYRLVDDHGTCRYQLLFVHPVAAYLFIRTLRAGGAGERSTSRGDLPNYEHEMSARR
jgi:hypothetical protein